MTWFGALAYNRWNASEVIPRLRACGELLDDETVLLCPVCGSLGVVPGAVIDWTSGCIVHTDKPPPDMRDLPFTYRHRVGEADFCGGTLVSWGSWADTRPEMA